MTVVDVSVRDAARIGWRTLTRSRVEYDVFDVQYTIIAARPEDLPLLSGVELAAARLLAGHAPDSVLAETTRLEDLMEARRHGHLWVALADDMPVGFAHVEVLEPTAAHLEEIDVHPDHGRRGLGSGLVMAVRAWAGSSGFSSVTLTTFRDVPWNMPFYARLGFRVIPAEEVGPALLARIRDETRRGLDPARRVAMRLPCAPSASTSNPVIIPEAECNTP